MENKFDILKKLADLKSNVLKIPSGIFSFDINKKRNINFETFLPLNRTSRILDENFFPSLTQTEDKKKKKNKKHSLESSPYKKKSRLAIKSAYILSGIPDALNALGGPQSKSLAVPSSARKKQPNDERAPEGQEEFYVKKPKAHHKIEFKYDAFREIINRKEEKPETVFPVFSDEYEKILVNILFKCYFFK